MIACIALSFGGEADRRFTAGYPLLKSFVLYGGTVTIQNKIGNGGVRGNEGKVTLEDDICTLLL
jgi:hypothetical protein